MIYDRPIEIARLNNAASPLLRRLTVIGKHYCSPQDVYSKRFYEALQAGVQIDMLAWVLGHNVAVAGDYAIYESDIYRVVQAQRERDKTGLACTVLSLHREDDKYAIVRSTGT